MKLCLINDIIKTVIISQKEHSEALLSRISLENQNEWMQNKAFL